MNRWRDFWTATPARVLVYHFVLLPLVIVLYLPVFVLSKGLQRVTQAVWMLCRDVFDCVAELADPWCVSYRMAMKQAKERGGVR